MKHLLIFVAFLPALVWAYDPERAKANLASDYATCSAYFILMPEGHDSLRKNPKFKDAAKLAWDIAVELSNADVTKARMELATKDMMKDMKFEWSNAAIVINKYSEICKEAIDSPKKRFQYWLDKKD